MLGDAAALIRKKRLRYVGRFRRARGARLGFFDLPVLRNSSQYFGLVLLVVLTPIGSAFLFVSLIVSLCCG